MALPTPEEKIALEASWVGKTVRYTQLEKKSRYSKKYVEVEYTGKVKSLWYDSTFGKWTATVEAGMLLGGAVRISRVVDLDKLKDVEEGRKI